MSCGLDRRLVAWAWKGGEGGEAVRLDLDAVVAAMKKAVDEVSVDWKRHLVVKVLGEWRWVSDLEDAAGEMSRVATGRGGVAFGEQARCVGVGLCLYVGPGICVFLCGLLAPVKLCGSVDLSSPC